MHTQRWMAKKALSASVAASGIKTLASDGTTTKSPITLAICTYLHQEFA